MNDEVLKLITKIDIIQSQNNINADIGQSFVLSDIQYIIINDVYYYLHKNDILYVFLQTEYVQFKIGNKQQQKYCFEIRYCNINNIYIQR